MEQFLLAPISLVRLSSVGCQVLFSCGAGGCLLGGPLIRTVGFNAPKSALKELFSFNHDYLAQKRTQIMVPG